MNNCTTFKIFRKSIALLFLFIFSSLPTTAVSAEEIKSKAAVVMDASTGRVLYAKNPGLKLMPASTTKLMTALVVMENTSLDTIVTIGRNAAVAPPIKIGLREGDKLTIEMLLNAALIRSANDAAVALAEATAGSEDEFVNLMNWKAVALGLENTRFINSNGLPGKGQYTTAYELAEIMKNAMEYPLLKEILGTRIIEVSTEDGKTTLVENTNKLLWTDQDLTMGKTGYTRQARHCFVGAGEHQSETLIVALLGAPSRDLLWKETASLIDFGTRVLNNLEEPIVLITKVDYDTEKIEKASYKKKQRIKKLRKKRTAAR
jgi:D-alanyl-D-alanine carboxypeptidase (penicillin-binding protein 5/6)